MNEKELIEEYKRISEIDDIDYSRASNYFKSLIKHYKSVQDGIANSLNFFDNTIALFKECDKPKRKPDFISDSGSIYWYFKKGVIRGADHWGDRVANCSWAFEFSDGKRTYGYNPWNSKTFSEYKYGFCRWEDFILKSELLDINGKEILTSFKNKIDRDKIKIGKSIYQRKIHN